MLKYENVSASIKTNVRIVSFQNGNSVRMFGMHWHKSTELLYCHSGRLEVRIHSKTYTLNEGELMYINTNVPHETRSKEPNSVHMIQFKQEFYDPDYSIDLMPGLYDEKEEVLFQIRQLILEIARLNKESTDEFAYLKVNSLLFDLKFLLCENFIVKHGNHLSESSEIVKKIEESLLFIDKNYMYGISVKDVAEYTGYSVGYFSRKFTEILGITCIEYMDNRRLQKGLELLEKSNQSIMDIAINAGFPNVKSFRTSLYKDTKMTPSQYRDNIKSIKEE